MFRSSISYGIRSVSELEPFLVLCCIYNLVVDLQQEAPYVFAAKLKTDSDSGVTWKEKNKLREETCDLTKIGEDFLKNPLSFKGCGLLR